MRKLAELVNYFTHVFPNTACRNPPQENLISNKNSYALELNVQTPKLTRESFAVFS